MTHDMHRRRFLQAVLAGTAASALPLKALAAQPDLLWMVWENLAKDEYLAPFLARSGVTISKNFIGSDDEQFAKLRAGGDSSVDLITPGLDKVDYYMASGLVQEIDLAKIPNTAKIYDAFKNSPLGKADGKTYGLPFYWGINPLVYRKDLMDAEPDWSVFFEDSKYAGKLAMRDYALEAVMIAAMYLEIPRDQIFHLDDAQLAEVKKALIAQKKLLRTYWSSIGDLTNLFATGEVVAAYSWVPPYHELNARGLSMGIANPKQGTIGWADSLAIPKGVEGEKLEAVYALIDYLLGEDYGKMLAVGGPYAQSTSSARDMLSKEERETIFIEDMSVMDSFIWRSNPERYNDWVALWNEVKAS
ncbi:extracellular solute-binding protein [Seohaeicola zhoushanensis]|uniref:ABC transporter n=1 Tax=Seohaeicola zhoushanensis TaxID=1569283 RepID=A0A8J3M6B4_9RHOB|nr:extracellular solute-binding protein [Seohaeicola zhoushanensis]GHF42700.1 ABC transporter [Seohaeicola zhoushanensis]